VLFQEGKEGERGGFSISNGKRGKVVSFSWHGKRGGTGVARGEGALPRRGERRGRKGGKKEGEDLASWGGATIPPFLSILGKKRGRFWKEGEKMALHSVLSGGGEKERRVEAYANELGPEGSNSRKIGGEGGKGKGGGQSLTLARVAFCLPIEGCYQHAGQLPSAGGEGRVGGEGESDPSLRSAEGGGGTVCLPSSFFLRRRRSS